MYYSFRIHSSADRHLITSYIYSEESCPLKDRPNKTPNPKWQINWMWTYGSTVAQLVNNLPAMQETQVWCLSREDPLEKEMATNSSILAWRIPWTEEPGRLQSEILPLLIKRETKILVYFRAFILDPKWNLNFHWRHVMPKWNPPNKFTV